MQWVAAAFSVAVTLTYYPNMTNGPRWLVFSVALLFVRKAKFKAIDLAFLLFVAWCAASLMWSPDPKQGALQLFYDALAYGVVLYAREDIDWPKAVSVGYGIALLSFCFFGENGGVFGNRDFASEFILIGMPIVCADKWGRWLIGPALLYLFGFNGSAEKFLILGCAALYGCWGLARTELRFIAVLAVIAPLDAILAWHPRVLLMPVLERAQIWIDSARMWWDAPLLGNGLGSFNYVYPYYQNFHLTVFPQLGSWLKPQVFAADAHNVILQVGSEVGLVGCVLAVACMAFYDGEWWGKGALAIAAILSLVSFPIENPASLFLICVALGNQVADGEPASHWRKSGRSRPVSPRKIDLAFLRRSKRVA